VRCGAVRFGAVLMRVDEEGCCGMRDWDDSGM
jgi:hypothetical protein